jgi:hypothetical protein
MEGLSLRSMVVNCFFSLVILLYLADNDTRLEYLCVLLLQSAVLTSAWINVSCQPQLHGAGIQQRRTPY